MGGHWPVILAFMGGGLSCQATTFWVFSRDRSFAPGQVAIIAAELIVGGGLFVAGFLA